jgi:multiple sugar transport system permease protein
MIFSIIWHWNDFFRAAMYLKDREHFTLAQSLAEVNNSLEQLRNVFNTSAASVTTVIMASCVLYVLPVLIMYIIVQRRFVKSIDRVGITG